MSSRPYMPLYISDYLSATEHLDAAHSGAYLHLIMHYWQKGGLPIEDKFLARIARMTERQWASAKPAIKAFFREDWTHERIENEIARAEKKAEARALSGSRGGMSKALNYKKPDVPKANDLPKHKSSEPPSEPLPSSSRLGLDREANASQKETRWRADFVEFWTVWPNKVGKPDAMRAFERTAKRLDYNLPVILEGITRYVRDKPADRPWLNPATFLNQERWSDQPAALFAASAKPRDAPLSFAERIENFVNRGSENEQNSNRGPPILDGDDFVFSGSRQ